MSEITKEICDKNRCPLVPPNCKMFFLTPSDMHPIALADDPKLATEIWFSPFESNAETSKSWSHDSDFPISLRRATGGLRAITAATALFFWNKWIDPRMTFMESIKISDEWKEWALAEPDDDDEDDDDDLPPIFKESQ